MEDTVHTLKTNSSLLEGIRRIRTSAVNRNIGHEHHLMKNGDERDERTRTTQLDRSIQIQQDWLGHEDLLRFNA